MSEIWVSDELIAIADISDYMGDKYLTMLMKQ